MKATGALLLRGMRWRLGTSVLTVVATAIAVGAAVLGPLYLHTAGDSVVRTAVKAAPPEALGTTVSASSGQIPTLAQIESAAHRVQELGGRRGWYGAPIISVISGVGLIGRGHQPLRAPLASRSGVCRVLRFRAGRCELGFGDVVVSDRSARVLGISAGAVITASTQGAVAPLRLRVTGIYAVPNLDLPYWWGNGRGYLSFGFTSGKKGYPGLDSLFSSNATALEVPAENVPQIVAQVPLRAGRVGLSDKSALQRALSGASAAAAADGIVLTTQLPGLLAGADQQRHAMATIVVVAAVQLVLLAMWMLVGLLARSSEARQPEIRVARLRGFPASSLLVVSAAEPAVLCLVGIIVGAAAAWVAVAIARDRLLDSAAAVSPDVWTFLALAATIGSIAGALGFGALRMMRASARYQVRSPARASANRASLVVDAVLLVLSAVALVALGTSGALDGRSNPIASAAPGLIALGVAVVAVHLVLVVCRLGVSASAYSERVAAFLALRQIVRRPTLLRQARVLIIALGLACFAASAWSIARSNRAAAAQFSVGTSSVVGVTPQGVALEPAVRRADPAGRFAMAAEAVSTPSSILLAVDAPRLPAVAAWPHGVSDATISATAHALRPSTAPAIELPDAPIRVTVSASPSPLGSATLAGLDLAAWVFNPQTGTNAIDLGPLRAGAWSYRGPLAEFCSGGCRLAGLGVVPAANHTAPAAGAINVVLEHVDTRGPSGRWVPTSGDVSARGWRPLASGVQVRAAAGGGVEFVVPAGAMVAYTSALSSITMPMVEPADHPVALPSAVTSEVESLNGSAPGGQLIPTVGLDGNTISIKPSVTVTGLPRVGGDAAMVDLDLLRRTQVNATSPYVSDQVWLGPAAPADALARLRAAGLQVDSVQTATGLLRQMQRSGPALADDFLLVATIVALIAAAASTLAFLGATTRQRATELTALEVNGIRRPVLVRSLAVESGVLALTALFGAGAGVLAVAMAVPSLPELAAPPAIPLQYVLPGGLMVGVSAAVVAVVVAASTAVALILMRRMSPLLLRTAPDDTTG